MKYKLLLILFAFAIINSCRFPKEEFEKFEINTDASFVNILIKAKFYTDDSLPIRKISMNINGKDAKHIYDIEGKTNFNAEGGVIDLILGPNANPTNNNPICFTIQANMEGYLPLKQDVFVFNSTQKITINCTFKKPVSLPTSSKYSSLALNFLGKTRLDTAYFNILRNDGINFTIKYPTKGLFFLKKNSVKFRVENNEEFLSNLLLDTTKYSPDSGSAISTLTNKVFKYNIKPIEDKITVNPLTLVSAAKNITTKVGYLKPNLIAEYNTRKIPDTTNLSNVRVNIITQSSFQEFGYTDENGVVNNNYTSFSNAVGIPQVFFYDASTGIALTPYYADCDNGAIIEANLPINNYKIFIDAIDYSSNSDMYYNIKRVVNLKPNFFEPSGTEFKLIFKDNMLNGRFFLFNNAVNSCGFANVEVSSPNIPLNRGFYGKFNLVHPQYDVTYDLDYSKQLNSYRVPAFANNNTSIKVSLNHPTNLCRNNSILFNDEILNTPLCNFTTAPLNVSINYNPTDFLSTINDFKAITANAKIVCPSGNFIFPPTIDLYLYQLGCNSETSIRFENGTYNSPSLIEDKKTYILRYDKLSQNGLPTRIYDTLYFDSDVPEKIIKDDKTGYWEGTLTYNNTSGFEIDVLFDNRKLRYNIPNCK